MSYKFYKPGFLRVFHNQPVYRSFAHTSARPVINAWCFELAAGSPLMCWSIDHHSVYVYIGIRRMDVIVCYEKVLFGFYHICLFFFAPHRDRCCSLCLYLTVTASGRRFFSVHLHFPAMAFSVKGVAFSDTVVLEQALT